MNMKRIVSLGLILLSLSVSSTSFGASYDCNNAKRPQEKMICADEELSSADSDMEKIYKEAFVASEDKEKLKSSQLKWIKSRDLCSDKNCMLNAYQQRINFLVQLANIPLSITQGNRDDKYPVRWDSSMSYGYYFPEMSLVNPILKNFLKKAVSAKESFLADYKFSEKSLAEIPPIIGDLSGVSEDSIYLNQVKMAQRSGTSWIGYAQSLKIEKIEPHKINFTDEASDIYLLLVAWGDYNHDGLEDILAYSESHAIGGNSGDSYYYILSRKPGEKLFRVIEIFDNDGNSLPKDEYEPTLNIDFIGCPWEQVKAEQKSAMLAQRNDDYKTSFEILEKSYGKCSSGLSETLKFEIAGQLISDSARLNKKDSCMKYVKEMKKNEWFNYLMELRPSNIPARDFDPYKYYLNSADKDNDDIKRIVQSINQCEKLLQDKEGRND